MQQVACAALHVDDFQAASAHVGAMSMEALKLSQLMLTKSRSAQETKELAGACVPTGASAY